MKIENSNIPNLENLLENTIKSNEKLVKFEVFPVTAKGENYGSVLRGLKITLKNEKTNERRDIEAVSKSLIIDNDFFIKMFKLKVAFNNEIGFYSVIVPSLQDYLTKNNFNDVKIDFLPGCFGCRRNLKTLNDDIDNNAIIILENLKSAGFTIADRFEGYNYVTTKMILHTLAKFHTMTLSLKIKEPQIFQEKIIPYLVDLDYRYNPDLFISVINQLSHNLITDPECSQYLKAALKVANLKYSNKIVTEKWATIMHNDIWVTNIMLKHDETQKVIEVKLLDFQACEYKSCLRDLLMFLFTSVSESLLEKHLDEFLEFYHAKFVEFLEKFGIETKDYSRTEFDDQLKTDARESEFYHIVNAMNATMHQEVDMDVNEMIEKKKSGKISKEHKEKLLFVTREFGKRGWLY